MAKTKRAPKPKRLLSVDWDFFFPATLEEHVWRDWGAREANLFIGFMPLWNGRAASELRLHGKLPGTSGEERKFWGRFKFKRNAKLFVAESHAAITLPEITNLIGAGAEVVNFDAHHDAGYSGKDVQHELEHQDCGNWVVKYLQDGANVKVVYPKWKGWFDADYDGATFPIPHTLDNGQNYDEPFDAVFICRSGAWTPPWIDQNFIDFICFCPILNNRKIVDKLMLREFRLEDAQGEKDMLEQMMGEIAEKNKALAEQTKEPSV